VGDRLEGQLQQLLLGVADQLAERLVDLEPLTVETDERHSDRGVVERGLELLVRPAQRLRGLDVLVHY
jgi:hypothetical protein